MNDPAKAPRETEPSALSRKVGAMVARKLKARRNPTPGVWYGLGMMGLIGWSVAVPTLLGVAIGVWLDSQKLGERSWTLALLVAGLAIGCLNAWLWVAKEAKALSEEEESGDE